MFVFICSSVWIDIVVKLFWYGEIFIYKIDCYLNYSVGGWCKFSVFGYFLFLVFFKGKLKLLWFLWLIIYCVVKWGDYLGMEGDVIDGVWLWF